MLRKLIDSLGPHMFVGLMTTDGILIEANRPALEAAGLKSEDVLGKPFAESYWWSYSEPVQQQLLDAIRRAAAGQVSRYEVLVRVAENQLIPIDFSLQPAKDETGKITHLVPSAVVITELKRAEERLRESRHFLERILDSEPGTVYIYDVIEQRNVWINPHWLEAFGYTAEETQAMGSELLPQIFHPEDLSRIVAHHEGWQEANEEAIREIKYRVRSKSGLWHWLHSRETIFTRDEAGRVKEILGVAHDITERVQSEEELQKSESRLRAILETEPACIKVFGPDGRLVDMNAVGLSLLEIGCLEEAGEPSNYPQYIPEHWDAFLAMVKRAAKGEKGSLEYLLKGREGTHRWMQGQAVPLHMRPDEPASVLVISYDITERKQTEEALRETEEQLRLFVEYAPAAIVMLDCNMRYIAASRRWFYDYGIKRDSIIGCSHYEVFPDIPEQWREIHRRCLSGAVEKNEVDPWVRSDGVTEWVRWEIRPWHKSDGKIGGLIIFSEIITEQKRMEETAKESRQFLDLALRVGKVGWWVVNPATDKNYVSPEFREICGIPEDAEAPPFDEWANRVHPEDRERFYAQFQTAIRELRQGVDLSVRFLHPDGSYRWLSTRASGEKDSLGMVRVLGATLDITTEKQTEQELRQYACQLQELTAYLQSIREVERTRIAREIHDELGQALTAMRIELAWIARKFSGKDKSLMKKTQAAVQLVDSTIETVRRIAAELRPAVLDLGLAAAVEWQVNEFQNRTNISCELKLPPGDVALEPECATNVFRILQESLTNVTRHAEATHVKVVLERTPENLVLEVCDNGKGIAAREMASPKSLGLIGMHERASLLGGMLTFERCPGGGTLVRARIPLTFPNR